MNRIIFSLLCFLSLSATAQVSTIDSFLMIHSKNGTFNGTALIAKGGRIIYNKGWGVRNLTGNVPHDPQSVFQIGSLTKAFTALAIMQLEEEGKLSVKDKLEKYFPGLPNGGKITIEHLLTHTSGFYNYTNDTVLMKRDVTRPYSQAEMLAIFKNYKPDFEPGTKWNYSNSGYSLLGYIIEKVEKKAYEKVIRERILQPLGMTKSGFDFTNLKDPRRSTGYFHLTDGGKAPVVDSTIAYSAGAIYSTTEDLYKWSQAVQAGKLLSKKGWATIFQPYMNRYGYGWSIDSLYKKGVQMHSGGIHGFSSFLIRVPEDDVTIILLDNTSGKVGAQARSILAILYNQQYPKPVLKDAISLTPELIKELSGEYKFTPLFSIKIFEKEGKLFAHASQQDAYEIIPEKQDLFTYKELEAKLQIVRGTGGVVTGLILLQNGYKQSAKKL